jgi:hypothetical protein
MMNKKNRTARWTARSVRSLRGCPRRFVDDLTLAPMPAPAPIRHGSLLRSCSNEGKKMTLVRGAMGFDFLFLLRSWQQIIQNRVLSAFSTTPNSDPRDHELGCALGLAHGGWPEPVRNGEQRQHTAI